MSTIGEKEEVVVVVVVGMRDVYSGEGKLYVCV